MQGPRVVNHHRSLIIPPLLNTKRDSRWAWFPRCPLQITTWAPRLQESDESTDNGHDTDTHLGSGSRKLRGSRGAAGRRSIGSSGSDGNGGVAGWVRSRGRVGRDGRSSVAWGRGRLVGGRSGRLIGGGSRVDRGSVHWGGRIGGTAVVVRRRSRVHRRSRVRRRSGIGRGSRVRRRSRVCWRSRVLRSRRIASVASGSTCNEGSGGDGETHLDE